MHQIFKICARFLGTVSIDTNDEKQIDSRNRAIIRFLMDRAKSDMAYHANELAYKTQSKCGNNHNFNLVMVNPQ